MSKFHLSEHNSSFFTNPSVELFLKASPSIDHNDTTSPSPNHFNASHIDNSTKVSPKAYSFVDSEPPQSFPLPKNNKPTTVC